MDFYFLVLGHTSEESDVDLRVNLMDLVDDVIDENSPLTSPTSTSLTSEGQNQRFLERSLSHDPYCHPRLRSILKRSRSDGGTSGASSGCDTDDDALYPRPRSTTYSNSVAYSESENELGRRRHKSVSFLEEPIVFEIQQRSRRQQKRSLWEQKKREELRRKSAELKNENLKNETMAAATTTSTDDDEKTNSSETAKKKGRKARKAEKKRNRNNSESRSEEEPDISTSKKKGKRKKKGKKGANMNLAGNNSGSDSIGYEGTLKPALSNPLIFELD